MEDRLIRVEEMAMRIGVSYKTIQNWYAFKKAYPDHELSKLLPECIQSAPRQTRYWREEDVEKLKYFKSVMPRGGQGQMSAITQKYIRTRKERENATAKN